MLWKPAGERQGDGRYGVGGGKAERAAWFASTLARLRGFALGSADFAIFWTAKCLI
jgi:hypothetical protein